MAAEPEEKSAEQLLAELVEIGQEQLRWQRAAVLPQVRETIDQALNSTKLRKAYELCDGSLTGTEIAKKVGASQPTFSEWAKRWRDLGIAYELPGRKVKHLASLKSLGLALKVDD
jgi:DNA-binding transcriptional ArsR family regulator